MLIGQLVLNNLDNVEIVCRNCHYEESHQLRANRDEVFARIGRALREIIPEDEREQFLADFQEAGEAAGLRVSN